MIFADVTLNIDFLDLWWITLWYLMLVLHNHFWADRSQKPKIRNFIQLLKENH